MRLDIKALAIGIVEEYGTNDPFQIAELLEIPILFHELPDSIGGYRLNNMIILNNKFCPSEQKWIVAHELGHYFIHGPEYTLRNFIINKLQVKGKCERQADKFASELMLANIDTYTVEDLTSEQIASMFSVPKEYVYYKLVK